LHGTESYVTISWLARSAFGRLHALKQRVFRKLIQTSLCFRAGLPRLP